MTHKIYIQSFNRFPISDWALSAYMGWKNTGVDIIFFEDIEEVPASKWHIVVADIESTNKYFERLGLPPKMSLNIPECLEKYTGRKIRHSIMGEVRHAASIEPDKNFPIFIKPDGKSKEFIGGVIKDKSLLDFHFKHILDETPVLLSEVVNFVTEYRAYICQGEVLGLYWYSGDFFKFPDVEIIKRAVPDYKDAPAGYSMDFGVLDDGRTVLVECNDGWSLGNYGLEPSKYCRLLSRRWIELMKSF